MYCVFEFISSFVCVRVGDELKYDMMKFNTT